MNPLPRPVHHPIAMSARVAKAAAMLTELYDVDADRAAQVALDLASRNGDAELTEMWGQVVGTLRRSR